MKEQEKHRQLQTLQNQLEVENAESNLNRSRSITVGTTFGGTTEVSMRGNGNRFLYSILQPVEVLELIHQLAANIGCHIAVKPRDDFGSWREWRVSDAEKKHLGDHPPFVNDMAVFQSIGASGFNQQKAEAIMEGWLNQKEYEHANDGTQIKKDQKKQKVTTKKI